ncbi:hypothetical protein LWH48_16210 [Halomonas sp. G15]|uniref:hypothetical protein n=1 Tax=Halomonas sp. G15 TaxID=2903521 RepID=UPI001E57D49F|nr:hypothetical protein [Halomonas sp. G15]MCE0734310.1 hypothetical protein [Halomonas sp. G15]
MESKDRTQDNIQTNNSTQKPLKKVGKKKVSQEDQQRLDNMRRPSKASKVCSPRAADKKAGEGYVAPKPAQQPRRKGSSSGKKKEEELTSSAKVKILVEELYDLVYDNRTGQALVLEKQGNRIARPLESKEVISLMFIELMEQGEDIPWDVVEKFCKVIGQKVKYLGEEVRSYTNVAYGENNRKRIIDLRQRSGVLAVLEDGEVKMVEEGEPTIMLRLPAMAPYPLPATTPDPDLDGLNHLIEIINTPEEEQYLVLCWMAYVLSHPLDPMVSQVFLVLLGGQGAGKSSFSKWVLRRFVDPSKISVSELPKNLDDLAVASNFTYMVILDNLRDLPVNSSDRLCRMSTGGESLKRQLYSDGNAFVSSLQAPLVINGIVNPVTEPDLSSRCLFVHFQALGEGERITEKEMVNHLEAHEGEIFRALLELAAQALNIVDDVVPKRPQRMLDFSRWLAACEQVMGLEAGYLEDAYAINQAHAYESSIGEKPLANALYNFALLYCFDEPWMGTCGDLLPLLEELVSDRDIRAHFNEFPHNAASLGRRFTQHAASLDALGVKLERLPRSRNRQVKISLKADCPRLAELAQD